MKKRLFSLCLAVCLLCTLFPQFSFPVTAADDEHNDACCCNECCQDQNYDVLNVQVVPMVADTTSSSDITNQLTSLKNTYTAGSYWNHKSGSSYDGYSVTSTPCGTIFVNQRTVP